MKPLTIAADFDDFLFDHDSALAAFASEYLGRVIKPSDFIDFNLARVLGLNREEEIQFFNGFFKSNYLANALPLDGSVEKVLKAREQGHEIGIITARPRYECEEITHESIRRFYPPNTFKFVEFTTPSYLSVGIKKPIVAKKHGVNLAGDDSWGNVMDYVAAEIPAILFLKAHSRISYEKFLRRHPEDVPLPFYAADDWHRVDRLFDFHASKP